MYNQDHPQLHVIPSVPYIQGPGKLLNMEFRSWQCPAVQEFDPEQVLQDLEEPFDNLDGQIDPYDAMAYVTDRFEDVEERLAFQDWEDSKCLNSDWDDE
jgi:hypothetical protein